MKQLLVLITMLLAGAAHGQIQEKDLLGEWKLTTAQMHGVILNFETGTVTEEPGSEGSYTADDLKKIERGIKGPHPFPVMVKFNRGGTIDIVTNTANPNEVETETLDYTLLQQDGHDFIVNANDKWEVRLENGLMRFIFIKPDDSSEIIMDYKK